MLSFPSLEPMTDAQDKAFKAEAIRSAGQPPNEALERWLNRYIPPPKPTGPPKPTYYECRRAFLVQKQARMTALMEVRARGLKDKARRWPRYRPAPGKENQRVAKEAERKLRIQQAAEAEAAREEQRAVAARVAVLMQLRHAPKR